MVLQIVLLMMIYAFIAFLEIRPLVQNKQTKALWTVSLLFLIGFVVSLLLVLKVQIPIPNINI